ALTGERIEGAVPRVLRNGPVHRGGDRLILMQRGRGELPIEHSAAPMLREDGSIAGIAVIIRDLSERVADLRRITESEERFRLLVASVRDYAIFMLSPAGSIMSWNQGAERIKGYSAEEVIGRHFS